MMKNLQSAFSLASALALCGSLASCANAPSRPYDASPQDTPTSVSQQPGNAAYGPKPALTIQSGEGEKLNLPWFVRDVQDWVNEGGAPAASGRPPR